MGSIPALADQSVDRTQNGRLSATVIQHREAPATLFILHREQIGGVCDHACDLPAEDMSTFVVAREFVGRPNESSHSTEPLSLGTARVALVAVGCDRFGSTRIWRRPSTAASPRCQSSGSTTVCRLSAGSIC